MSNNYMTEQYMASILQQYQQNSPQKTSTQTGSQNFCQSFQNEEQNRTQLNESLFKSIDDSFGRQLSQITVDQTRMTDTPLRVQQMVRNPVITSDSFRRPEPIRPVRQQNSGQNVNTSRVMPQSVDYQYYNQPIPQTPVRPQTYRAKVIDYSNGTIGKPKLFVNPLPQNQRQFPTPSSFLSERNIDPMAAPMRTIHSVNALHSAISTIGQNSMSPKSFPKPILKNCAQNMANHMNPEISRLAANTSLISSSYGTSYPKVNNSLSVAPISQEMDGLNVINGIIQTLDLDNNKSYYCYHCNIYMKREGKAKNHCNFPFHIKNINETKDPLKKELNKWFIYGQIAPNNRMESIGLTAETVFRMELNRIPMTDKYYYCMQGIRLTNPGGPDAYYCRFCEQSIQSLENICEHLWTKTHIKNEKRTTFAKYLSQTTEPMVGLQHITEYMSPDLLQPIYECSLCMCFEDAYNMYRHVCSFKHRINLLKKFNPNETTLDTINESPQAVNEIRKRIAYLSKTTPGGGFNRAPNKPNFNKIDEQKRKHSDVEVIDITDDMEQNTQLENRFAIQVSNEEEATHAAIVIQALKQSVVKYYLNKIPAHMRRDLINQRMDDED